MNLICGINPVLEALGAGTRHFERLLVVKGLRNQRVSDAIARASRIGVPLRFESREILDRMAGGVPHQGVIAVVSAKPTIDLEDLFAGDRQPSLLVALDGVEDPRNLGAILRSCEAAGAEGVLLPDRHSAGLTETVGRASAGALEHVRVARVGNLAQALEGLKARGLWVVGFDASAGERWHAVDLKRPVVLVLGGEGRGIRRLVRERCDQLVSIPLFGHVASLNVSVAAGVALFEVVRQRGTVPSHVRPIPPGAPRPAVRSIEGPPAHDAEHDPGATPRSPEPGSAEEPNDERPEPIVRLFDEDVAWGRAAEAYPAPEPRSVGRERERRRRPERSGGRRDRPGPTGPEDRGPAAHGSGGAASAEDRQGRRRRRRRRGRGPEEPAAGAGAAEPRGARAEGQGGQDAGPRGEGEAGPGGEGAGRRRRRRWRRRRGGPQG